MSDAVRPSLVRILTWRIAAVAVVLSFGLLVFFAVQYLLRPEELARKTLEAEATAVAEALGAGQNPARWTRYAQYPHAYAFRVFEKNRAAGKRELAEANADLIPPLPPASSPDDDPILHLEERFGPLPGAANGWMQTSRESVRGHGYWVELAMIGDPAWVQRFALADELLSHVGVPAAILIPSLTIAMLLTTRRALRPLTRVAAQARVLGAAAASGRTLTPLSSERLPQEAADVVSALNAMLAQMDRALARQRAFATDAAHELRTPLSVLRLQVAALPPGPEVARIDEELAALAHLIAQLLRFAQAEDVMASDRRPVDIGAAVRDAVAELVPLAVAKGLSLELVAPEDPVVLPSHSELVGVVARNLVENAMRVSPRGGVVTIRIEAPGALIVEDDGPGVPDALRDAIFQRLWQADRERERDGSAGIGLALVRRIAELHGGNVTVERRPEGGARFVVRFRTTAQEGAHGVRLPSATRR